MVDPASTGGNEALSTAAVAALHQGNKIEAIKIVRMERNVGLKEAKDAVDEYVRTHPALQATLADRQSESKRRALFWLIGLALIAYIVYYFLVRH